MALSAMTRGIDELGRVVIPGPIRRRLGLAPGVAVEVFTDGPRVILRPYTYTCRVCRQELDLATALPLGDAILCAACVAQVQQARAPREAEPHARD